MASSGPRTVTGRPFTKICPACLPAPNSHSSNSVRPAPANPANPQPRPGARETTGSLDAYGLFALHRSALGRHLRTQFGSHHGPHQLVHAGAGHFVVSTRLPSLSTVTGPATWKFLSAGAR